MSNTVPDSCCSYEDCGKRPELAYDKVYFLIAKADERESVCEEKGTSKHAFLHLFVAYD